MEEGEEGRRGNSGKLKRSRSKTNNCRERMMKVCVRGGKKQEENVWEPGEEGMRRRGGEVKKMKGRPRGLPVRPPGHCFGPPACSPDSPPALPATYSVA